VEAIQYLNQFLPPEFAINYTGFDMARVNKRYGTGYTAVVYRARKTLRVSTTATIAQIPAVLSKDGAVIGAVLSTRKFHRGHH
jgi:hypothetical protein